MKPIFFQAFICLCLTASYTVAMAQKTLKMEDVRRLVESKKYPVIGTQTTKIETMTFSTCVSKINSIVKQGAEKQVSRTIVSTNVMRVEKIWSTDAATTLTCIASDKKLITTTAGYL